MRGAEGAGQFPGEGGGGNLISSRVRGRRGLVSSQVKGVIDGCMLIK